MTEQEQHEPRSDRVQQLRFSQLLRRVDGLQKGDFVSTPGAKSGKLLQRALVMRFVQFSLQALPALRK
jgi:hypothetical protein